MQRSSSVSRASGEFFIDLSTTASVGLPVMHNSNLYSALLSVSDDDDSKKESITDLINDSPYKMETRHSVLVTISIIS
ncbi:hypothetical protein HN51_003050 [Arachis hypogaea]